MTKRMKDSASVNEQRLQNLSLIKKKNIFDLNIETHISNSDPVLYNTYMNQPSKLGNEKRFLLILDTETRKYLDELSEEALVSRAAFARLLIRAAYKLKQKTNINIVFDEVKHIRREMRKARQLSPVE